MTEITRSETEALIALWKARAHALGYKKGTATARKMESEFFAGAFSTLAALGSSYPHVWNIVIMSERSLSDTLCPDQPGTATAKGGR
jgi:hypothetical protein